MKWGTHIDSYSLEDTLYHGNWGTASDCVVDKPAYTDWTCSKCGTATTENPDNPLLLTMDKYEAQAASYVQSRSIRSGYLLGGETLSPDGSARLIFGLSCDYRISVK